MNNREKEREGLIELGWFGEMPEQSAKTPQDTCGDTTTDGKVCERMAGHDGQHMDARHRWAPGHGQEPTGAKAAQINAAPEVGAPTGAVHEKCRCYDCWIEAGKPTAWLAAWMTPTPDLCRSLDALGRLELALRGIADETHLNDAEIVRRALLSVPCDPEADAYREDATRELQKTVAFHTRATTTNAAVNRHDL